jgi:hypothetical protein
MTTADEPHPLPPVRAWGYLACAWCVLFAALHIYWAVGGDAGLASSAGADLATHRPLWFVLLGLWGVALLLLAGAAFSIGMTRWRLRGRLRRGALILGWLGGAVLLTRGLLLEVVLLTGAGGIRSAVGPLETHWSLVLWNPWFVVGGLVVLLATRQLQRV